MKNETFISFYLKSSRIHVFIDSLRAMGNPRRICFMLDDDGRELVLKPYDKTDLKSHAVPIKVYNGAKGMEVSSQKLCRLIAARHQWDTGKTYRVPGIIYPSMNCTIFALREAEVIEAINSN